jgi:serine/threonine protein kinase
LLQVCGGEGEVTVLRADCGRAGEVAIQHIPAELAADTSITIEAEASASRELPASFLLLKQVLVRSGPLGAVMVSQWGGDSLQCLLEVPGFGGTFDSRVNMADDMLACIGLGLQQMAKTGRIHRDIKPGNVSFHAATGSYRLLDFGISIRPQHEDFFQGFTFAYVEPSMALVTPDGQYAMASREGQAAATSLASDIWALCLTALQMLLRRLPDVLDYERCYGGEEARLDYLDALAAWDPTTCKDLNRVATFSKPAADLLRRGLARDAEQRLTLQQLLEHPFVASRVAKFSKLAAQQQAATRRQQQRIADMFAEPLAATVDADQLQMPATPTPGDRCASCSSSCSGSSSSCSGSSSSSSSGGGGSSSIVCAAAEATTDASMQQQQQQCVSNTEQCVSSEEQPSGCFGGLLKACFASKPNKAAAAAASSSNSTLPSLGTAAAAAAKCSSCRVGSSVRKLWSKCKAAVCEGGLAAATIHVHMFV